MFLPENHLKIFLKPWLSGTFVFFSNFFGLFQLRKFSSVRIGPNHFSQSELRFTFQFGEIKYFENYK